MDGASLAPCRNRVTFQGQGSESNPGGEGDVEEETMFFLKNWGLFWEGVFPLLRSAKGGIVCTLDSLQPRTFLLMRDPETEIQPRMGIADREGSSSCTSRDECWSCKSIPCTLISLEICVDQLLWKYNLSELKVFGLMVWLSFCVCLPASLSAFWSIYNFFSFSAEVGLPFLTAPLFETTISSVWQSSFIPDNNFFCTLQCLNVSVPILKPIISSAPFLDPSIALAPA